MRAQVHCTNCNIDFQVNFDHAMKLTFRPVAEVGSLAVVFTDLRRSAEMYRDIGDEVAVGLVLDHLDLLRAAIASEGGVVVKTRGAEDIA